MGRIRRRAELRRQDMKEDAAPVLGQAIEPGERVQAAGFAYLRAWWSPWPGRLYWVAITDRRLILIRFHGSDNLPVFERALPRVGLRVVGDYESRLNRELKLEADQWKAKLRFLFPLASKSDADAFLSAIENTRKL